MRKKILAAMLSLAVLFPCMTLGAVSAQASDTTAIENQAQTEIELGTVQNGTIATTGATKTYYFTTTSNDSFYTLTAKNITIQGYGFYAEVYDSYDNLVWSARNLYANRSETANLKLKPNETYRVYCYASEKLTGTFSFLAEETKDDLPDARSEAKKIKLETTVEHTVDGTGDVEWFKFTTTDKYSYYKITSNNVSINGYGYYFELYDYNEQLITEHTNIYYGNSKSGNYKLDPGTTYYIKCYASGSLTGNYSFTINEVTDDTYDEKENASTINVNTEYTRKMEVKEDVDFFKFKTGSEDSYTFSMKNMGNTGTYGLYSYIYSETNEQMTQIENLSTGNNKSVPVTLKPYTTYYLKVYSQNGVTGFYRFSIVDSTGKITDSNDDMSAIVVDTQDVVNPEVSKETQIIEKRVTPGTSKSTAATIALNQTSYGTVASAGGEYWYKFTTTSNDSFYQITGKNVSIEGYGWYAYCYDSNMNQVWSAVNKYENNWESSQIKLQPNSTYYFKCYASGSLLGGYSITVEEIIDDLPDAKSKAKKVNLGEDVVYRVDASDDVDWFAFTTEDDDAYYKVYSKNLSINGYGFYFYIYNGENEIVAHKNMAMKDAKTTYIKLEPSTTYYVKCTASSKLVGNYLFNIEHIPDDVPDTQEDALVIEPGIIYDRKIEVSQDVDYYRIKVAESGDYTFYTKTLSTGSYGLYTTLTDAYGDVIAKFSNMATNNVKSQIVSLVANKTYYIKANTENGKTGDYRFYVANSEPQDEFPVEIPTEPDNPQKPKSPFDDVTDSNAFYYNAVLWAVEEEVTNGITPTRFGVGDDCTRGHVVTFLWRSMGKPEPKTKVSPFDDVNDTSRYYYKAVLWAYENNITTGVDDTHFSPDVACTRAQIVTFLWRTMGQQSPKSGTNPFYDVTNPSAFYYNAVLWAVENEVTNGMTPNKFGVNDPCTRAQIVTFLYRCVGQ